MNLEIRKKGEPGAGLLCLEWGSVPGRDFFVKRDSWQWGYEENWYDGPLPSFGLGPPRLLAWW